MARDLSTPLAPSVFDGKKMKTLPAKEIKLKSKDKHLGKKGHDSYEVDGRTTFVKPKFPHTKENPDGTKKKKTLFGGTKEVYKGKGDKNSPIKNIKQVTVKGKDGKVKKRKNKVKYKP